MVFRGSRAQRKFFLAKTQPEEAVGMVDTEVGALSESGSVFSGGNILMIGSVTIVPIKSCLS